MRTGISVRLGVLLAAFGVLATGLTGLYSYSQSRALLVRAAERDLQSATQVFGRRLTTAIHGVGDNARLLTELQITRGIAFTDGAAPEAQLAALADTFQAMLNANPEYFQIRLISAAQHGLELVRVDRDGPATVRVSGEQLQEKGHFPYVFGARQLSRGEVYLSKIGINHELGSHAALNQPTLNVASPVVTVDGKPFALIVIGVDVTRVFGQLQADLPSYLKLFLANEWGDFLIHPDASQTYGFDQGRRVLMQDTFADMRPLLQGSAQPVLTRADIGSGEPNPVLASFIRQPLGNEAKHGFVVLGIAEPLASILESTRILGGTIAQIVLAFSAAAIALAALAARVVTRPLNQMTREVKRFSSEHVVGELPTQRGDEIGELARGFHEMQLRITSAMAELDASRRHLSHVARHDTLTGLPNRAVFIDRVEHAIQSARRSGRFLAVLFIDLDNFKDINDTFGHAVGDEILVLVAEALRTAVREADTVARLGGDEFVILLESMDEEQDARRVAQALIDRVAERIAVSGRTVELGLSIGISLYPRDGSNASELIRHADEAMYLSKQQAGNRYSVFGSVN
ncbi:MAG TPA: GGDEF domain-containing protein [Albitalea sp.]|nr:GGDEF domain-containing protein [Albitalea sp.]